jgi:hypothetical protein
MDTGRPDQLWTNTMTTAPSATELLGTLQRARLLRATDAETDGQLLEADIATRDEAASTGIT